MMQYEFEERLGRTVDSEVYHVVEAIYRDAGWVSDVGGKDQVVEWMRDPKNAEVALAVSRAWGHEVYTLDEAIKGLRQGVAASEKTRQIEAEAAKKKIEELADQVGEVLEEEGSWIEEVDRMKDEAEELLCQIEMQKRTIRDLERRVLIYRIREAGFTAEEISLIQEGEGRE